MAEIIENNTPVIGGGAENEALNENQNKETVSNDIVRWNVGGVVVNDVPSGGGSGGGSVADIEGTPLGDHKYSVNKPMSEILEAMQNGARIRATATVESQGAHVEEYLYLGVVSVVNGELRILVTTALESDPLAGSESDGVTTFGPM